jgi:hypothetical protein
MRRISFDPRWVMIAVIAIIIASANRLPWPIVALALAVGGGYALTLGWQTWRRTGGVGGSRIVYWRGQRIEMGKPSRMQLPAWRDIGPAAIYFVVGGVLVLAALAIIFRGLGIG